MQPDLTADLIRMFVERILEEVFPDETGAARLQEVGLFTMIYMLQNDPAPVTAARLAKMSGQGESQVHRLLRKLVARELVERKRVGARFAWHLSIKHTDKSRRLIEAIRRATEPLREE